MHILSLLARTIRGGVFRSFTGFIPQRSTSSGWFLLHTRFGCIEVQTANTPKRIVRVFCILCFHLRHWHEMECGKLTCRLEYFHKFSLRFPRRLPPHFHPWKIAQSTFSLNFARFLTGRLLIHRRHNMQLPMTNYVFALASTNFRPFSSANFFASS